jgi:hypothetical protein
LFCWSPCSYFLAALLLLLVSSWCSTRWSYWLYGFGWDCVVVFLRFLAVYAQVSENGWWCVLGKLPSTTDVLFINCWAVYYEGDNTPHAHGE